ncbi:nucleoid-associated protein [Mucilaginibacter myungsuensis]|uniref:Nucleoid-associated protein n=1 Tax=Mucilaginibacter myungsuensis TaxID=649104 RepID=A0A929PX23_9SPHI|nr:nucleoid-associated protein [Mucilaginibacter myungsuensis]MBE9661940.1 nucleoid-associated protein [Mucilaginibacter myungsuensis]MDN3599627.1 nucleoid-associated protein [Mucilaginibacter myungsuensis]
MVTHFDASLDKISVHHVGNQSLNELYALSEQPLELKDELIPKLLMKYFLTPFEKANEVYHLMHPSDDLNLNVLHHFATMAFEDPEKFHEASEQIAKQLYNVSNHPNIKPGELYVAYFHDVQIEGNQLDVIGIFKSENKETYLKVYPEDNGFGVDYEENAININKLDKGCLIFNIEKENGYKVVVIDKTNTSSEAAVYWKDQFLQLKIRNDSFNQTNNTLSIYKNFVTQKLDDEFEMSKADKIDLLNRSMKYFKEKETFDIDEFGQEVIGNPEAVESFKAYKSSYEEEFDTPINDNFQISDNAVKKQQRVYKSVLKLDKNFHIYIHGDNKLIEKGFDDEKSMNYYKVYFREEQ